MALDSAGHRAHTECLKLLAVLAGRPYGSKLMLQAVEHLRVLAAYKQGRASLSSRRGNA